MPKVYFISLGCPKNRVDSEVMLGHLLQDDFTLSDDPAAADILIVNTCTFIEAATKESLEAIIEMAEIKKASKTPKILLVSGCLAERYANDLQTSLKEVDYFLGTGSVEEIANILRKSPTVPPPAKAPKSTKVQLSRHKIPIILKDTPKFTQTATSPRVIIGDRHSVYLKISEGCSHNCAFCIIPQLRGPQKSRLIPDILREAEDLINLGAKEINLVAQDLCAYGKDFTGLKRSDNSLTKLLQALEKLGEKKAQPLWIRLLYAYPQGIDNELIDTLAQAKYIVPYLDMPIQHISDELLRSMKRRSNAKSIRELLTRLKNHIPDLTLRTTFITGLPGETPEHFQELAAFIAEMQFANVGVFTYSREEGTLAATMPNQVPKAVAKNRQKKLMQLQQQISTAKQQNMLNKILEVLVDGFSEETTLLLQGRHKGQAKEIDGVTYISSGTANKGDIVKVLIKEYSTYDIAGSIVN